MYIYVYDRPGNAKIHLQAVNDHTQLITSLLQSIAASAGLLPCE